ncbi:MAG: hypothetical protein AAB366_02045 [Patescibacteria group bacterium]|mgnify:CR=1 FL=1
MIKLKKLKILIVTFCFLFLISNFIYAAVIDPIDRWAWNDIIGWIDFGYPAGNVNVYSNRLEGYASSSVGFIALNCNSTPNGNICGASDFKVSNDGAGNLSGWAYNDNIGWISFASTTPVVYSVSIDSGGDFHGWAWNDIIGWISFNSAEGGGSVNYKVKTLWSAQAATGTLTSSVFDAQVAGGVAINTIMWQGSRNGGAVKFQIASSNNSAGPWTYYGPNNTSLDNDVYSPTDSNAPIEINPIQHNNKRYVRYKAILESNLAQTQSPTVNDIIINWSP